jgi:hypothetical protein
VRVSYEHLATSTLSTGLRGGLCRVKSPDGMRWRVIIDKRAATEERVATLATALGGFDTSQLELPERVREHLKLYAPTRGPSRAA